MRYPPIAADPWAGASWEGAEATTLAAGARLTLPERLRWLEQAAETARQLAVGADEVAEPATTLSPDPPAPSLTLLELLATLGGAELEERWTDEMLAAALLRIANGRRILVVERTYREGIRVLLDPSEAELTAARASRLWDLWNSERAQLLAGAV